MFLANTAAINNASHPARPQCVLSTKCLHYHTVVGEVANDTTASNSGYKSGAHFRLEKRVHHAILQLECRKHVHELHVSHANKAVFGPTKGPQKSHYKRFKETWSTLKLDKDNMCLFDWGSSLACSSLLTRPRNPLPGHSGIWTMAHFLEMIIGRLMN